MNHAGLTISCADVQAVKGTRVSPNFILSMEDELMRRFGSDHMMAMMDRFGMDDSTADSKQDGFKSRRICTKTCGRQQL